MPCIAVPATARDAPTNAPITMRGMRTSSTTALIGLEACCPVMTLIRSLENIAAMIRSGDMLVEPMPMAAMATAKSASVRNTMVSHHRCSFRVCISSMPFWSIVMRFLQTFTHL